MPLSNKVYTAKGGLPLVGHLFSFRKNPLRFIEENFNSQYPLTSFRLLKRNFFIVNHPDFVRHILVNNAKNYSRRKSYAFLREILGEGLLTSEGEHWKKHRRIAQPAFYKDQLAALLQEMEKSILQSIKHWENCNEKKLDLYDEMNDIALAVLCNSIIQTDLKDKIPQIKSSLADALNYLTSKRFSAIKWIHNLPTPKKRKGLEGIATMKKIIRDIISERRKSSQQHNDLLSMLMAAKDEETQSFLSDEELLDEVMTVFIAGHETTAVALTWAFYLIAQHSDTEDKILEEIHINEKNGGFDSTALRNLSFTMMTLKEVMRLYPPVWTFGRQALENDELNGIPIPAGTFCTLPTIAIHKHPDFWEKPNEFYPQHFLPEKVKERHKHAYFPFSAGQHLCLGEHFALIEMQLTIAHLLKRYKIKLVSKVPIERDAQITLKPKTEILFKIEKR